MPQTTAGTQKTTVFTDEEEYSTPQPEPLLIQQDNDSDKFEAIEALQQLKSGGSTPKAPRPLWHGSEQDNNYQYAYKDKNTLLSDDDNEDPLRKSVNDNIQVTPDKQMTEDVEDEEGDEQFYDTNNELMPSSSANSTTSLDSNGKKRRFLNDAIQAYSNSPAIKYGVEIMERATQPMVNIIEQKSMEWKRKRRLSKATDMFPDDVKEYTTKAIGPAAPLVRASLSSSYASNNNNRGRSSNSVTVGVTSSSVIESLSVSPGSNHKRQKLPSISEALARGNELSLNMSIESRKRLNTCLQLLVLANKQLSSKIIHLQDLINKEQELNDLKQKRLEQKPLVDGDNDVFHDAASDLDLNLDTTNEIKQEIVGTVKKVVTFISKYAGKSLPEPERSNVRQELLKLPNKWATQASNSILGYNTNGKVLVLANESLEMVKSVSSVFDESLVKAELWIKKKQEKQLAKQAILNSSLKRRLEKE